MNGHDDQPNRCFIFSGAFNIIGLLFFLFLLGECERPELDGNMLSVGEVVYVWMAMGSQLQVDLPSVLWRQAANSVVIWARMLFNSIIISKLSRTLIIKLASGYTAITASS